ATLKSGLVPQGTRLALVSVSNTSETLPLKPGVSLSDASKQLSKFDAVTAAFGGYKVAEIERSLDDRAQLQSIQGDSLVALGDDWYARAVSADQIRSTDLRFSVPTIVAVIDSGVDLTHPALQGFFWKNH